MKAKTKLTKLWSFLLALVMLLSLLPTTVLAASPDASSVFVDGDKSFYNSTRLYYKNGDSAGSFTGTSTDFNAAYDPATGTLTLNGYSGGSITVGGSKNYTDITVVLKGTNIINDGSLENAVGGDITVTSSDGGTLSITRALSGGNAAIGIETGLSASYTTGNVTIKGNAKVTINMTHNGTSTYEKAYGIYAKENITISENASVDITCATPNNTTGGDNCNGLRAVKDVIIDTTGTIKIDVTNAGGDSGYSFGIYPSSDATLNNVGNMEVKWKKHATHSSYPGAAIVKGGSFNTSTHAVNVDETNCYASYRKGTPYTVTVENGTLTGPGVKYPMGSGMFLKGDKVSIKADTKTGNSGENIPFKGWTSEDVTIDSPATTENNSFTVPGKDVTVTATYNPFDGSPTFTPTGSTNTTGTLTFKTVVKPDGGNEYFRLVKDGEQNDESKYISFREDNSPSTSPYEYSYETRSLPGVNQVDEGDYYVVEKLNGTYYLSEKFTVNYTAAPAGNYSDSVRVYNANKKLIGLGDGECLTANNADSATSYTSGTSYVARYDKSTGTLYLKDYHGVAADGQIYAHGDLNIVVENDSSFTTSVSATNNLYGIQANGKLNISGSGKLTVTATGRGDVYGIYANEGVTISAPLDVRVGETSATADNGTVYGIYTQSGAISLSGGDKAITATGGSENVYGVYNAADTSTTITDNGNIDISGKLTVNLSNGSNYNRGISSQGGVITLNDATVKIPGNYYYGIFNNNGNVVITSSPDVDISSDISGNNGICTYEGGDLTIENSIVSIRANGYAADLEKGKLSIKDSIVDLTRDYNHYSVVNTANDAANTIDLSGSGTVTLTASGNQSGSSMIGGTVSITTPGTKLEKGTYYPDLKTYDGEYDATSDKTVLQFVHESAAPTTYTVSFDANGGTGTMAAATGVSGEYTLPENGFTAPDGKQFKAWSVGGSEKAVGDKITITANTTVTAVWEAVEYNVTVTGGTASVGAGTPITKATMGTTVTLTAGAAPSGQMFDKWVVENGDITLADATSATTTFTMPAGEVSVKATYKDAPHTHPKISSVKLSTVNYTYNGSAKKPSVTVKDSKGTALKNGTDYTVSYASGRTKIGKYKVTVTFKGNYSGSKAMYFEIGPKNPSSVKTTLYGYDDVKVSWSKVSGASGYKVYYKKSSASSWTLLKTTTATSYKKANLSDGVKYDFKVVTYKKVNGNACENAGKTSSIYTLKKVAGVNAAKSSSKVKVSWTNISGETGYQISKSTSKTRTKVVATYKTTSGKYKTVSATKGKTYYYKVRAYKVVGKTKIYGPWSSVVKYKR